MPEFKNANRAKKCFSIQNWVTVAWTLEFWPKYIGGHFFQIESKPRIKNTNTSDVNTDF